MEGGAGRAPQLIVFDASTIVSAALGPGRVPWQALDYAREHDIIALSEQVAAEIQEVLARPKFASVLTPVRQIEIITLLSSAAHWFFPLARVTDCRDPDDNIYLELALAAGATALVASDQDLLDLDPWRGVRIVRPAEFLTLR